jgi:hypothetical protein
VCGPAGLSRKRVESLAGAIDELAGRSAQSPVDSWPVERTAPRSHATGCATRIHAIRRPAKVARSKRVTPAIAKARHSATSIFYADARRRLHGGKHAFAFTSTSSRSRGDGAKYVNAVQVRLAPSSFFLGTVIQRYELDAVVLVISPGNGPGGLTAVAPHLIELECCLGPAY